METGQTTDWQQIRPVFQLFLMGAILLWAGVSHAAPDFTLSSEPTAIAIHPDSEVAIISHEKEDRVTLFNLDRLEERFTIPIGRAPKGVAVNEAANTGLACNSKDKSLSVIDLGAYRELYSVNVGGRPQAIAVNPARNRGVVANRQDGTISEIDLYHGREEGTIPMGKLPVAIAVDPYLNYAVVVDDISPANDTVTVIDLDSRRIIKQVPVGRGPAAVDIDPETHTAVVANELDGSLTVIDLTTWEYRHIPLGRPPVGVAVSRVTSLALVLCSHDNLLLTVDLATGDIVKTYPVKRKATALALSPYSNRVAVVDSSANSLSLIQLDNPVPVLYGAAPDTAEVFSVPETITLTGNGFLKTTRVSIEKEGAHYQPLPRFIDHHTLEVALPPEVRSQPGLYSIQVTNQEPAGGSSNPVNFEVRNVIGIDIASPVDGCEVDTAELEVSGAAISGYAITAVTVNNIAAAYEGGTFTAAVRLSPGANTITATVKDAGGDTASGAITVHYTPKDVVPDPVAVAPPVDPTVPTDMAVATEFLYSGVNPVQTGVAPGTIEARRVAVLRGMVLTREGAPLSGVAITVLNHPEYGQTHSRGDGMFDLAVNGGGLITLDYKKEGYLPVQRQVQAPWKDYVWASDVAMIPVDPQVTTIELAEAETMQVARGTTMTDADGSRQAILMFTPGTKAEMILPDGTRQPLTTLNVRATEYTVGENGPKAMPAELPPTTAYTYCVELSVDEALAAGAVEVRFDRPVSFYVDNFIGFPVGGIVPAGYYDRVRGVWVPSENGLVVQIIAITNGLAELDITGNGQAGGAAVLAEIGITDEERRNLAQLYTPGKSFWRVPVPHFTPWDYNWPYGPPEDAEPPRMPGPEVFESPDISDKECGSIIEVQDQVLGERVEIAGTPFILNYRSNQGQKPSITIPLSGEELPALLKRIDLVISVAGRTFASSFQAAPGLAHTFTWDGKDAYGREVQGAQSVSVMVGYVYDAVYYRPADFENSFGLFSGMVTANRTRREITLWQHNYGTIDSRLFAVEDLGGWSLSIHSRYSVKQGGIINTYAGSSQGLSRPQGVAASPDGSLYIVDSSSQVVRRVDPDGIITIVAGTGVSGFRGDGGPAIQATLRYPAGVAVGPEGSLYIADYGNNRIRRVSPSGIITTVAGTGAREYGGDGGPATQASLSPARIAVDPDGSLYIADNNNNRIRRVSQAGIITTVAGTGARGYGGDGGPAIQAKLNDPADIAVGPDGSLYIADRYNSRIRRVGPDGIITTVAGNGIFGFEGDGGLAIQATLGVPTGVAVGQEGSLYIADYGNNRIRRVSPAGIITTVAGTGGRGYAGDGGLATAAQLNNPLHCAVGPDGTLYVADTENNRIRLISPLLALTNASGETYLTDRNGRDVFLFDQSRRHFRTLDATTGAIVFQFSYDEQGRLSRVKDAIGNFTKIERNSNGKPTGIVAPDGQLTTLQIDANGYLAKITNPAGEAHLFTYTAEGLMTGMTDPRGETYRFSYDQLGRLIKDEDPAGGFKNLSRINRERGFKVAVSTAMGRTTEYLVENLTTLDRRQVKTYSDGQQVETIIGNDASEAVNHADGTRTIIRKGPDPRFGMHAPIIESTVTTLPSGLQATVSANRAAILQDQNDPLSIVSLTDTVNVNGRPATSLYEAASRTWTLTSPTGRTNSAFLDVNGRIIQTQPAGLFAVNGTYDIRGRLRGITQGNVSEGRFLDFAYNEQGYLASITDDIGAFGSYEHDPAGRVTRQVMPDGREILYSYDANGNVTSITPPGRSPHIFNYTAVNKKEGYTPPEAGSGPAATNYSYNLDGQLTGITRPDGQILGLRYLDCCGKLDFMTLPNGQVIYGYNPSTGQLSNIAMPDGNTLAYTHDGFLPLSESWSGDINGTVARTYDNNFWLKSLSVNGQAVNFSYDNDGLLTQAGSMSLTRNAQSGFLTGTSLSGVETAQSYNGFGELTSFSAAHDSSELFSNSFVRDARGRITEKTETVAGITTTYSYQYDTAGRLTRVIKNGSTAAEYAYDENGNRLSRVAGGIASTGNYDAQDRMVSYGSSRYQYNANGELLKKTEGALVTGYTYDVLGNLRSVELPDGRKVDYTIDGSNRRIGKKVNGSLVQGFLYQDNLNPVAELDASGQVISRFVYASRMNAPDYMLKDGTTYRIITDHLGSPRLVVNASTGAIAQRIDYDEFGKVLQDTSPGFQPFGYAGGIYDADTSLFRFGARDYDPHTGRWTAKDPILFAGGDTNLYGYVEGDPVNAVDPSGLVMWTGTVYQFSYVPAIGAAVMRGTFRSECIDGKKATVKVWVAGPAIGIGGGYKNASGTGSTSTWDDYRDTITPSVFNGTADMGQIAFVPGEGRSHSDGRFGGVHMVGKYGQTSRAYGLDFSVSIMFGSSTVMDVKWASCNE